VDEPQGFGESDTQAAPASCGRTTTTESVSGQGRSMLSSLPALQAGRYRAVEPPGVPVAVELLDEL